MRHKSFTLIALALTLMLILTAGFVQAGTVKRTGTAGAMELLIPVGARGTALAGNYTAGISGIDAMYWNPAGIAGTNKAAEVMVSHMNYFADIKLTYAAVLANMGKVGYFGACIKTMSFGDIPVTTEYATDGTGEMFSPNYTIIGATYARAMTDRILFGFTTKLVSEKIMNTSASGFAFDFGVQYNTQMGLRLGVTLKNIGSSMRFSGSDLERRVNMPGYADRPYSQAEDLAITSQQFEMPTTMDIGLAYTLSPIENHSITAMGNFRNHQFGFDSYGGSLEYTVKVEKLAVSLRGGAVIAQDVDNNKFIFMDDQNVMGPSVGGGISYQLAQNLNLNIEYAYRMNERLSDNQVFSMTIGF
jgi:opacity protein-like surface antigen